MIGYRPDSEPPGPPDDVVDVRPEAGDVEARLRAVGSSTRPRIPDGAAAVFARGDAWVRESITDVEEFVGGRVTLTLSNDTRVTVRTETELARIELPRQVARSVV